MKKPRRRKKKKELMLHFYHVPSVMIVQSTGYTHETTETTSSKVMTQDPQLVS